MDFIFIINVAIHGNFKPIRAKLALQKKSFSLMTTKSAEEPSVNLGKILYRGKTQSKHPISLNCFYFNRLLLAAHVKAGKKDWGLLGNLCHQGNAEWSRILHFINEVSHFNSAGRDIERINIRVCLRTVICILLSDLKLGMLELRC